MNDRDRQIENAIDRAVREMMSGEPRADLRHRVHRQLEPRTRVWVTVPRLAAATGLAAAAVLALLLLRPAQGPIPAQTVADAPLAPAVSPAPRTSVSSLPRVAPTSRASRGRSIVEQPTRLDTPEVIAAIVSTEPGIAIEPLPSIDPITIAPVRTTAMDTPAIFIPPIEVEQLEIGSLSPPR